MAVTETILVNKIKCKHCGDVLISDHTWDFRTCRCGRVSVDGGRSYLRRVFVQAGDYEELSEIKT